ncbi:hypothetical protein Pcinc_017874, partial [Petrolisthes cinctipes]
TTPTYSGCYEDTADAPLIDEMALGDLDTTTLTSTCPEACLLQEYAYAAISSGAHCFCTNTDPTGLVTGTCELLCGGVECGSANLNLFTVYETGGGSVEFTMTATNDDTAITITITSAASQATYLVDFGTGGPLSYYGTTPITVITALPYLVPGEYPVSVLGMIEGTELAHSENTDLSQNAVSALDLVECPVVWEPDEMYYCNVTVTPSDESDTFTATFDDDSSSFVIQGLGSDIRLLGPPVPWFLYLGVDPTASAGEVQLVAYPVTRPSQLIAYELYAKETGAFTAAVKRYTCSDGAYPLEVSWCIEPPVAETCPAPEITCPAPGTPSALADVPDTVVPGSFLAEGHHRELLPNPVDLLPGDLIVVSGPIGLSPDDPSALYAAAVVKELLPIQVSHICTTVNVDVLLTVVNDDAIPAPLDDHTSCERNITDIELRIEQATTDTYNATANVEDPYYIRSVEGANFIVSFSVGGPITINITAVLDAPPTIDDTHPETQDFPLGAVPHELTYVKIIADEGSYTVTTTAGNQHNEQEPLITPPSHVLTLNVQHEVKPTWVVNPDPNNGLSVVEDPEGVWPSSPNIGFVIPATDADYGVDAIIRFTDSSGSNFPTNATAKTIWGDGSEEEILGFTGPPEPILTHNYTQDGIYNVSAFIGNVVSGHLVDCQVLIVEEIKDFAIANSYIVRDAHRPGFGTGKNMYPQDKNLTFFPSMTRGTVDYYIVTYTENGSEIMSFEPVDRFNPTADFFYYHFDYEVVLNLTVTAYNVFGNAKVDLQVEIIGEVRGCVLDDFSLVSAVDEVKTLNMAFTSVGAGTCLLGKFGDTSAPLVRHTYGEESTCKAKYPDAIYHEQPYLDIEVNITHVYREEGVFNVTFMAFNDFNNCSETLMTLVTDIPCNPPIVSIVDQTMDTDLVPKVPRSKNNIISSTASLNCELTSKTKKRWQLYHAKADPFELSIPWTFMRTYPSWNTAELMILKNTLEYGLYYVQYTLTMWDPDVPIVQSLPFQKQAESLIEIVPGELIAVVAPGMVSRLRLGPDQTLPLAPCENSIDPDYPENKTFQMEWGCRNMVESYPDPMPDTKNPIFPKSTGGGCFGYGPGLLDHDECDLSLQGSDFMGPGTFEIMGNLMKDVREKMAHLEVEVLSYNPPLIIMECASPSLCTPFEDGIYINPCKRIGIIAKCLDDCGTTLDYLWEVKGSDGTPFAYTTTHFPVGYQGGELAFSTVFFDDNPDVIDLHISVSVTDPSDSREGGAVYFFKVNQKPTGGTCMIEEPLLGRALIDLYYVECDGWTDPEGMDISRYVITMIDETGSSTSILEMLHRSSPPQRHDLVFPPGIYTIIVKVLDEWDSCATYEAIVNMTVKMPSPEDMAEVDVNAMIQNLNGTGDTALLSMLLIAQSEVARNSPETALDDETLATLTEEEINERLEKRAEIMRNALEILESNSNLNTLDSLDIASGILAKLMEDVNENPTSRKIIDSVSRDRIESLVSNIEDSLDDIEISQPADLMEVTKNLATVNVVVAKNMNEGSKRENGTCKPNPAELKHDLPYSVVFNDIDDKMEKDMATEAKCNVLANTKNQADHIIPSLDSSLNAFVMKMMEGMVLGETLEVVSEAGARIKMMVVRRRDLSVISVGELGSKAELPDPFCPVANCTMDSPMGCVKMEFNAVAYAHLKGSDKLSPDTMVVVLRLYNRDMKQLVMKDLPDDQRLKISVAKTAGDDGDESLAPMEDVSAVEESKSLRLPVVYSTFDMMEENTVLTIQLKIKEPDHRLFLLIHNTRLPSFSDHLFYKYLKTVPMENGTDTKEIVLLSKELAGPGRYFMGIGQFSDTFETRLMNDEETSKSVNMSVCVPLSTDYSLRFISDGVAYLNHTSVSWESDGIEVVTATRGLTVMYTNHLTSFGAGMFVLPNTIDFNYVFANMAFTDNLTIYLTLIFSLLFFIVLLIFARYKDKRDFMKLGGAPLPDNKVEDKYLYEVLVVTGNYKWAQTDSNVQFILSGDREETDIRTLADESRKTFRKDSVDDFVMAVPRPLGPLQFLRIWHDSSGSGPNASWFLSYVVFRDVQTGEKFEFINNKWLAVEMDDGQIERLIPVAGKEQKKEFNHLFLNTSNKNIADEHLWFSIFLRPHRSRFSRCQRVATCFALLFLSMLVDAMWYERVPDQPGTQGLNLGPFHLSPDQIAVVLMGNLIVFIPSILIAYIFRKSGPRKLRKNRFVQAVRKTKMLHGDMSTEEEGSLLPHQEQQLQQQQESSTSGNQPKLIIERKEKKKKFTLPWWMFLFGWLLVLVCIGASIFFLLMYGIMFGNYKTTKWLTSLVISFFTSILFVEPVKIFLTTMVLSAICKKGDLDEDDADEDEEDPVLEQDERWLHPGGRKPTVHRQKLDDETLARMREQRRKEMEMWSILKEIFTYCIFLWIFLTLSYGNRDPNAYFLQMNLRQSFIHEGYLDDTDFTKVTNANRLWLYLQKGLLRNLQVGRHYNGDQPIYLRGYLNDQANRMMGYTIIRQIRVIPNTCQVPGKLRQFTENCASYTNLINEDGTDYCSQWSHPNPYTYNTTSCNIPEFKYTTASQLESLAMWGQRDWYGGGGYVIRLNEEASSILTRLHFLQRNGWIDEHTRAVLIEFSVYNTQVNLFGLCLLIAEFTPGGGITPYFRFEGIRLLQHINTFAGFIIALQVAFVLFVIYFTLREIYYMYKQGFSYWRNYWSYAEVAILLACYTAILLYIFRHFATMEQLKVFEKTKGIGYMRMQFAALLDELYGYVVGFIVFVGTLKFIKLLRFNKRIGVLSATLSQCWDDLSGFLMAFFLCFFSFVAMFYLMLNKYLDGFYNFVTAVETCFSMMLGKFQFEEMKQISAFIPIMFFIFVLCNSWVLINLLLTLIIKSFTQVKYDLMNQPNEYEMVAFVWGRMQVFLGMSGPTHTAPVVMKNDTVQDEADGMAQDPKTLHDFPNKVDKFLDHINNMYFDGKLDVSNKEVLKNSMYRDQGGASYQGGDDDYERKF